jgi:hypothetical protein
LDISSWKIPTDINLADKYFIQPGGIDLLIGADLFYKMLQPGRQTRPGDYPVLQETVLGWTVARRIPANTTLEDVKHAFLLETNKLDHFKNHFWKAEPVESSTKTARQKAGEEHLHTHNPKDKRRVVNKHPIKMEAIQPGTSRHSEGQGPQRTDIKLGQGPKLKVQNHNFMKEHEETNHMKTVRFQEGNKTCHVPSHSAPKEKGSTLNQIASDRSATCSSSTQ